MSFEDEEVDMMVGEISMLKAERDALRAALTELLRVHTGPKLNDEGPSYRAVVAARKALGLE